MPIDAHMQANSLVESDISCLDFVVSFSHIEFRITSGPKKKKTNKLLSMFVGGFG